MWNNGSSKYLLAAIPECDRETVFYGLQSHNICILAIKPVESDRLQKKTILLESSFFFRVRVLVTRRDDTFLYTTYLPVSRMRTNESSMSARTTLAHCLSNVWDHILWIWSIRKFLVGFGKRPDQNSLALWPKGHWFFYFPAAKFSRTLFGLVDPENLSRLDGLKVADFRSCECHKKFRVRTCKTSIISGQINFLRENILWPISALANLSSPNFYCGLKQEWLPYPANLDLKFWAYPMSWQIFPDYWKITAPHPVFWSYS